MNSFQNHFHHPTVMHLTGRSVREHLEKRGCEKKKKSNYIQYRDWSPYENNGGNICAVTAEGKLVLGSDSR